jgi:isoleucyl-tRNA synthetase
VFKGKDYTVIDSFTGERLVGMSYVPPFDYYARADSPAGSKKRHVVLHAEFATDESGTGIVHQAPEFGEDDFNLAREEGVFISEAMNKRGEYTAEIADLE